MKISVIKTNTGIYANTTEYYDVLLINDVEGQKTYTSGWLWYEGVVLPISKAGRMKYNYQKSHYKIKDPSLVCDKLPEILEVDEVLDEDGEWEYEYSHLESLYEIEYTPPQKFFEQIDFEESLIMELDCDKIIPLEKFSYERKGVINKVYPEHPELVKIMYPSLLYQFTYCKYTTDDVYKILQDYIRKHIDLRYAKIVTDYDFRFCVYKVVETVNEESYDLEVFKNNGKKYNPRRFEKKYRRARNYQIFLMNLKPEINDDFKIEEITANNEAELMQKMKKLCEDVIAVINEPVKDCPHCEGQGVIRNDAKVKNV